MTRIPIITGDPGHGQYGNKGIVPGYYEGTQMWHLANYTLAEFRRLGWKTITTRPKLSDDPTLTTRGSMAKGSDLFYSFHSNAPGSSATNYASIRGVSVYDSVADQLDYLEVPLSAAIAKVMNTPDRGVKHRQSTMSANIDYFTVLAAAVRSGCPDAILVEHGFHTNLEDGGWLMVDSNLKRLALVIATTVDRLWRTKHGLAVPSAPLPTPQEDDMIFCRQGQGSKTAPNTNVLAMQQGFTALGIKMINNGVAFQADGSYGPATVNGCKVFEQTYKIAGDGTVFTDKHLVLMMEQLRKNNAATTGITKAMLDAEVSRTLTAIAQRDATEGLLKISENKVVAARKAFQTLRDL